MHDWATYRCRGENATAKRFPKRAVRRHFATGRYLPPAEIKIILAGERAAATDGGGRVMKQKSTQARGISLRLYFRVKRGSETAFGPGKAELLALIAGTGSINQAAKRMGMSYMRAWSLVQMMNRSFKQPLVRAAHGGTGGGGAQVTETGWQILALYRQLETKTSVATRTTAKKILSHLRA
jgi:molybdate transport system regulatory protein